jgi:23S rRNA (uracil1939-C5)-methyltransferase
VLAPFVLPGETALVEPEKESPGLVAARTVSIEAPAGYRVAPPCLVFGRCGGCHYQHLPYEKQLEAKRDILLETLARLGRIEWTGPVDILAGEAWGYRNRTQLHLAKRGPRFQIGYCEHGSHRLCPIESCPISSPALNRALAVLARLGRDRRFPEFLRSIELFTNEQDLLLTVLESDRPLSRSFFEWCAAEMEDLLAEPRLDYPAGPDIFRVSSRSFFQINRFLVPRLAGAALGDATGSTALDLYAGVGLFTLPLARRFERVVALDAGRSAVEDLALNARRAGLSVEVHHDPADRFLAAFQGSVDFVLADPPRAGLGRSVTDHLIRLRPHRLTLVSCDPATLARDLRALTAGGYRLATVKLVDLFPQSFHIESIIELQSG